MAKVSREILKSFFQKGNKTKGGHYVSFKWNLLDFVAETLNTLADKISLC